jgi:hypothetical protein
MSSLTCASPAIRPCARLGRLFDQFLPPWCKLRSPHGGEAKSEGGEGEEKRGVMRAAGRVLVSLTVLLALLPWALSFPAGLLDNAVSSSCGGVLFVSAPPTVWSASYS